MATRARTDEIAGRFLGERQRWGETIIARVRTDSGLVTIKAQAEADEITPGLSYRFLGRWTNHYRYGRQFLARTWTRVAPHDRGGIVSYLQRAPHVGPATARLLWELFGSDAVRMLRERPEEAAAEIRRKEGNGSVLTAARAREAARFLAEDQALEATTIDLMGLFQGRGFPRRLLKRVIRKWGNRAARTIRRNPFLLLQFPGCGFARTDTLYLELGLPPGRTKRQALCVLSAIARDSEGHTWFPASFADETLSKAIGGDASRAAAACKLAKRAGLLAVHRNGDRLPWITEAGRAKAENDVAELAARMARGGAEWPGVNDLDTSEHQRDELSKALGGRLGVFGGSPGTGKTYSAARLIGRIRGVYGLDKVAVVAPTGKAAVRITEALQEYGLGLKAKTIHSYLKVGRIDEDDPEREDDVSTKSSGARGWSFAHGPGNPVEEKFVICDESSMIDVELMASLLGALPADGHLLLVGDVNQLPPVGHGAPLRDFLAAGVPAGELREIRRNAGAIVETCARIRDEEPLRIPGMLRLPEGNLMIRRARDAETAQGLILTTLERVREGGKHDAVWDCQVIVAVNEKSPLSRAEMNKLLQAELNPGNRAEGKFWAGDKVVCLRNSFLPAVEEAMDGIDDDEDVDHEGLVRETETGVQLYVANGEIGRVLEDFPTKTIVEFPAPRRIVVVPKVDGIPAALDLGYAISCHKSQGSEWPIVVVALDDFGGARMVCDRSWLYTAISRAKRACILVGKDETAAGMVRSRKITGRKTFLAERIRAEIEKHHPTEGQTGSAGSAEGGDGISE